MSSVTAAASMLQATVCQSSALTTAPRSATKVLTAPWSGPGIRTLWGLPRAAVTPYFRRNSMLMITRIPKRTTPSSTRPKAPASSRATSGAVSKNGSSATATTA